LPTLRKCFRIASKTSFGITSRNESGIRFKSLRAVTSPSSCTTANEKAYITTSSGKSANGRRERSRPASGRRPLPFDPALRDLRMNRAVARFTNSEAKAPDSRLPAAGEGASFDAASRRQLPYGTLGSVGDSLGRRPTHPPA
jgi:hypothetical protein